MSRDATPPRTLVLLCPDWPATVAAGRQREVAAPLAVIERHQVIAASPSARAQGVRPGQRRREAESHCPTLRLVMRDEGAEVRAFEPLVRMLESFGVPVTVRRPGWASLPTRGPARRLGGEAGLAAEVARLLGPATAASSFGAAPALGGVTLASGRWWRLGIADGPFAATVAAKVGALVPKAEAAAFLAPFGVELLGAPELADLLRRLGLRSLGDFAAVDAGTVLARFGVEGGRAHRLARGLEAVAQRPRRPPPELEVGEELEPPAERLEQVVLVARALAERLREQLATRGLACTLLRVEAVTVGGERLSRCWSDEGGWVPGLVAERLRWQLEAWLLASPDEHQTGEVASSAARGISAVRLIPLEAVPASGRQLGLWGRSATEVEVDERVARVVARAQGMLGAGEVLRPVIVGGRGPAEQVRLFAFGDALPAPAATGSRSPWPGRLPAPAPAVVPVVPPPARLVDSAGVLVEVDGRGQVSAAPACLEVGGRTEKVRAWSGPWPADERWWDRRRHRRRARLQVLSDAGEGYLLALERGGWAVEGRYD